MFHRRIQNPWTNHRGIPHWYNRCLILIIRNPRHYHSWNNRNPSMSTEPAKEWLLFHNIHTFGNISQISPTRIARCSHEPNSLHPPPPVHLKNRSHLRLDSGPLWYHWAWYCRCSSQGRTWNIDPSTPPKRSKKVHSSPHWTPLGYGLEGQHWK